MKRLTPIFFSVAFILFWFVVIWIQIHDFTKFKSEMGNQVFPDDVSNILVYALPLIEFLIAILLVQSRTRKAGHLLTVMLMLGYSTYVGLALLNVYSRMPCNCAGLLGHNSSWTSNFILNLCVTAVAGTGFIFTIKDQERRKHGMDTLVSHAPSTR